LRSAISEAAKNRYSEGERLQSLTIESRRHSGLAGQSSLKS